MAARITTIRYPGQPLLIDATVEVLHTAAGKPLTVREISELISRRRSNVRRESVRGILQTLTRRGEAIRVQMTPSRVGWIDAKYGEAT